MTLNLQEFSAICENCELIKQALSDVDESLSVDVGRMRRVTISTFRYRREGAVNRNRRCIDLALSV